MGDAMSERWKALAVLFTVRVTMAVQFQSVAALSPFMMADYGLGLADIGLLIGLYLSPGLVIALPGGAIGRRFGDKRTVAAAMVLMLAGGLLIALVPLWEAQAAGRVLAGVGGVILNVLMSKMATDWFAGRDLATAMGIYVNSWPVGIALALLALPFVAGSVGLAQTMLAVTGLVALGLLLLLAGYRAPAGAAAGGPAAKAPLQGGALGGVVVAGSIWGLYNAALGMIFSFGPAMLTERGWSAAAAASTTSIALWLVALSVPLGGVLADRLRRRDAVLLFGFLGFAGLMFLTPATTATVPLFVALGLLGGLAAGPIMSLPGGLLQPGNRALGMGLFFTLFYLAIFLAPIAAGRLAEAFGAADAAFTLGGVLLLACAALLAPYRLLERRLTAAAA